MTLSFQSPVSHPVITVQVPVEYGLSGTLELPSPVRAGFIKIALESTWADCPHAALEGAARAALKSKAVLEIHTEKGLHFPDGSGIITSATGVVSHG